MKPFFQLNKEKRTSFKELRTAVKANCAALRREYMLEDELNVKDNVRKVVASAFKECNKAQKRVRKLRGKYLLKNLRVKCEIYEGNGCFKNSLTDSLKKNITCQNP